MQTKQKKQKSKKIEFFRGKISVNTRGVGFLEVPGKKEDITIENDFLNTALDKDEVEIEIFKKRASGGRIHGKVVQIMKRAKDFFVGTISKEKDELFLIPDDKKMYARIMLPLEKDNGKIGVKALAKITGWKKEDWNPNGEIVEILGEKGDNNVEMRSIALEKGFSSNFPVDTEREAEDLEKKQEEILKEEIWKRKDFRNIPTFTIDPEDAKDFDDAISFREISPNKVEVGVHIADVSHYVKEKTNLDREGRNRGFSVYLADRTIPMLPPALSERLCSLNPNEDRLAFSAVFVMVPQLRSGQKGEAPFWKVTKRWFGKTIIRSIKRFSYEEAQDAIDFKSGEFYQTLSALNEIARALREKRFEEGAIDFEQDEIKIILDENGKTKNILKKKRLDTHKLVEEFMLLANREVAEFMYKNLENKKEARLPFIYRIHDLPNREKISELSVLVKALGYDLPIKNNKIKAKDLQTLMLAVEGEAEESLIKSAAVRSMAKAIYSTKNIGHFGLAFQYYTHFTSPIRRYPDLLVHRLLEKHLQNQRIPSGEFYKFEKMSMEASEKEIAAAEAERNSKKFKQTEYMSERIGQEFAGIISGVTDWGIYVMEKETRSEGLIKMRDLKDDYYVLDEKNYCIIGQDTKKKFSLGDEIKIKVAGADIERRTIDYALVF